MLTMKIMHVGIYLKALVFRQKYEMNTTIMKGNKSPETASTKIDIANLTTSTSQMSDNSLS
jgi:hypothetical protein